jgi:ribosomal protein L37E
MNPEIEKLIDLALADGEITDKERKVILKKAEKLGEDPDEVEVILDGRLHLKSSSKKIIKCPNCGQEENGISQICSSCGFVLKEKVLGDNSKGLNEKINYLENLLIEIKSIEIKSTLQKTSSYFLKFFISGGLYGIYSLFKNKFKSDPSTNLISKSEKEIRIIKNQYGKNKSINSLIVDIENELTTIKKNVNKDKKTDGLGCLLVFLFYIVFSIGFVFWGISLDEIDENNLNEIKLFLKEGKLEEARRSILLLPDDRTKGKGKNFILNYEIEQDLLMGDYEEALKKSVTINDLNERNDIQDKIYIILIEKLLNQGNIKKAETLSNKINDYDQKTQIVKKVKKYENIQ